MRIYSVLSSALLIVGLLFAQAQQTVSLPADAPVKYQLQLIQVADTTPPESVITIKGFEGVGYKSLYSPALRQWMTSRPTGSSIEWLPGCEIIGGEPKAKEIEDFKAYCKSKGMEFIVHVAG